MRQFFIILFSIFTASGYAQTPVRLKTVSFNKTTYMIIRMIQVEGGTFKMGNKDDEAASPVHDVTVSTFSIGETEVTQELWETVMSFNPSSYKGKYLPVDNVTYDDCMNFINELNALTGQKFRLPTEAEWEYAARGGKLSQGYKYSGSNNPEEVAWLRENSKGRTHEVALKKPNELGIYDMSGNVSEWVQDGYYGYSKEPQTNPVESIEKNPYPILRGGSWSNRSNEFSVTKRTSNGLRYKYPNLGFRLALEFE